MSKNYFFAIVLLNIFLSVGCGGSKVTNGTEHQLVTSTTAEPVAQPPVMDPSVIITSPEFVQPLRATYPACPLDGDNATNATDLDNSTESVCPAPFVPMSIDDLNRILALYEEIPNEAHIQLSLYAHLRQGNKLVRALVDITDPNGHVDLAQGRLVVYEANIILIYRAPNLNAGTKFSCNSASDCEFVIVE